MLSNNNYYKNNDISYDNRNNLKNYFNPYEYNFESNLKNQENMDLIKQKSSCHYERKVSKNNKNK